MTIQLLNQEKKNFTIINMEYKITLSYSEQQEVELFCKLNNITTDELIKKSFKTGYNIEKYGLVGKMGGIQEKWVEKEVIQEKWVEIPVEVIKDVEKIVEVIKEVPVDRVVIKEVIKEVPVEIVVTKIEYISDKTSENELLLKIQQLEQEFSTKTTEIGIIREEFSTITTEMENIFQDKMSKKDEELDRLRQELDKQLDRQPIEKIVEVVVEKEITDNLSKSKLDALQNTLAKVRQETLEKDKKIRELEQTIQEIQKFQDNKQAVYLKGSNLDDKLYK